MSKNSEFFGDEYIHVCYIRAKFREEITFLLLCAKKDKISAMKIYFLDLNLVTRFVFFTQQKNIICSRNFTRMKETCICSSAKKIQNLLIRFTIFSIFLSCQEQLNSGAETPT